GALPVLALLDPGGGVPLVVAADPPRGASAHRLSGLRSFVCQQPVAESTVVAVGVRQHVGSIRLDDLSLGDLPTPPAVVGLPGELQDPQGHPDGDTVSGELAQERLEPFPGRFACERYVAARRRTSFSCSSRRTRRLRSRVSAASWRVVAERTPASKSAWRIHLCSVISWTPKSFATCAMETPSSRERAAQQRRGTPGIGSGHSAHPSRPP